MFEIVGKFNTAKCFATTIDNGACEQIKEVCDTEAFASSKIRIMPDVHSGKGCTIGTTMTVTDKIVPSMVGVDIGCGMYTVYLGNIDIDFEKVDRAAHSIPCGRNVWEARQERFDLTGLRCYRELKDTKRLERSLGTLGGGNHFIEIDVDSVGNKYLVVHSGSRNLGNQVARIYMERAISHCHGGNLTTDERKEIIEKLKKEGRTTEIEEALKKAKRIAKDNEIEKDLCYLEGKDKEEYLNDIKVCYKYAHMSRQKMAYEIVKGIFGNAEVIGDKFFVNGEELYSFETLHNYIDLEHNIIRKGAISAQKD